MKVKFICLLLFSLIFNISLQKKEYLEEKEDCKKISFLATEENVKITGRYYKNEDTTWLVQSGSSIEFYVEGQKSLIYLVGDDSIYTEKDFRPRFGVYTDDELLIDSTMDELSFIVDLYHGQTESKIKVKVILLSENSNGGIGIKGISTFVCSNSNPIKPVEQKKLSIEFLGDSITCAYGVEGKDQYEHFKTTTENILKSYAYLAAQELNAEYSIVCYSGAGIVSGASSGEKNPNNLFPPHYKESSRNKKYPGQWDFKGHKSDVILINLGTNDNNYVTKDLPGRSNEFIQGYLEFLTTVRQENPDSYIICTLGTMGCEEIYKLVEKAINQFKDDKISYFQSPFQNITEDGAGSDWHPSVKTHQKLSKIVVEKISEILPNNNLYKDYSSLFLK